MKRINGLFEPIIRFDNLLLAAHKASLAKRHKPAAVAASYAVAISAWLGGRASS